MLRRLLQGFKAGVRRLGPLLVTLGALIALGFGAHAALDWHRHGSQRAGFFHLHVYFGHHHHGDSEHDGHETPEPDAPPGDRRERSTLTLALGVAPPPTVAKAERPILETNDRVPFGDRQLRDGQPIDLSWSPRGPPV